MISADSTEVGCQVSHSTAMSPFLCQLMRYLRSLAGTCLTSCVVHLQDHYEACAFCTHATQVACVFCSRLIDLTCFHFLPVTVWLTRKAGSRQKMSRLGISETVGRRVRIWRRVRMDENQMFCRGMVAAG